MYTRSATRLFCAFIAIAISIPTIAAAEKGEKKKLKVFILAGQSNMVGAADVSTFGYIGDDPETAALFNDMCTSDGSPRVIKDTWISYYQSQESNDPNGVGFGPLTAGNYGVGDNANVPGKTIGPEFTFGIYMQKFLDEPILIIKTAWGGKSLYTDFCPPSVKYMSSHFDLSDKDIANIQSKGGDVEAERTKRMEQTGHFYRLMLEHVNRVLNDVQRVVPDYDEDVGYEIAGFVWFQGWNDLVNRDVYPHRDQPGGYTMYSDLMATFINDVRKDLNVPEMPFVIGVMGVGGPIENVSERYRGIHGNFREAMAAPAARDEFKGNVLAVRTAPFWDMDVDRITKKRNHYNSLVSQLKKQDKEGTITKEQLAVELKKAEGDALTPEEESKLIGIKARQEYHYFGSGKTMAQIGKAFAEATFELQPK